MKTVMNSLANKPRLSVGLCRGDGQTVWIWLLLSQSGEKNCDNALQLAERDWVIFHLVTFPFKSCAAEMQRCVFLLPHSWGRQSEKELGCCFSPCACCSSLLLLVLLLFLTLPLVHFVCADIKLLHPFPICSFMCQVNHVVIHLWQHIPT